VGLGQGVFENGSKCGTRGSRQSDKKEQSKDDPETQNIGDRNIWVGDGNNGIRKYGASTRKTWTRSGVIPGRNAELELAASFAAAAMTGPR
jgi:hypothetical protein